MRRRKRGELTRGKTSLRSDACDDRLPGAESENHPGAPALRLLRDDFAPMGLGYLPHDRQAEPGSGHPARLTCAIEAVEDVRQVLVRDPRAVIANDEHPAAQLDLDDSSGRAPLRRV